MVRGEAPPTAGLLPKVGDLFAWAAPSHFETKAATFLRVHDFILTCSGTASLVVALETLKTRHPYRRRVVIPGYTCPLVVLAIKAAGLSAIACDTKPNSIEIDPGLLSPMIDADTLAVVPAHFGGALADIPAVREAVQAAGSDAVIIEDAAQAFGARSLGVAAGLSGDIGIYSFAVGKGLTLYEGGGLVARTEEMSDELRLSGERILRRSLPWDMRRSLELLGYHAFYNSLGLRLTYGVPRRRHLARGDDLKAAADEFDAEIPLHRVGAWRAGVGLRAMGRLPAHLDLTEARFTRLVTMLSRVPGLHVVAPREGDRPSGTYVMVLMPSADAARQALYELWPSPYGVTKTFTRSIGDYPQLAGLITPSQTPNARDFAARLVTITTSAAVSDDDVAKIALVLSAYCR